MFNYKRIIEYFLKGNNHSQIATLCGCSRMTVIKVLKRIEELRIDYSVLMKMPDKELLVLLYPKRGRVKEGYLVPDYKWEEIQMVKHRASIRLCWRRYCKRAYKQNLKAYTWSQYLTMYHEIRYRKINWQSNKA